MRAFFAVDLHDTLRDAAYGWGRTVAHALGRGADDLSWVPAMRMHVTLHFLGEIDATTVGALLASLGEGVPEPPFEVALGAGGTFPASGQPRVLWLGVDAGADPLQRVHAWLQPRVAGIGQPDRHDSFSPHLTIARVRRDTMPGLGRALRDAATRTPVPRDTTRVASVTLMESVLSPKGPTYRPVAVFPLRGDALSSG